MSQNTTYTSVNTAGKTEYDKIRIRDSMKKAVHIEWSDLDCYFGRLLDGILGRTITVNAMREEYYYWKIDFPVPITPEELETLLTLAQADDLDREMCMNEDGEPIWELCESLCKKLMNMLLPFELTLTRADDEGVWFIGEDCDYISSDNRIALPLPNGMVLSAKLNTDPNYPSINASLQMPDGNENCVCFAELNSSRPDGRQICVCAYAHNTDEPTYYASYHDDGKPCEDA